MLDFLDLQGGEHTAKSVADRFAQEPLVKRLVILIGLPASGKSTLADELEARGFLRLSLDAIRAELFGDEAVQTGLGRVLSTFQTRLGIACTHKRAVVVDATSVWRKDRSKVLRIARRHGYTDITLVLMNTPLAECLRRNAARSRVVPEKVIRSMHRRLRRDWPRWDEGTLITLRPGCDRDHYFIHKVRPGASR